MALTVTEVSDILSVFEGLSSRDRWFIFFQFPISSLEVGGEFSLLMTHHDSFAVCSQICSVGVLLFISAETQSVFSFF